MFHRSVRKRLDEIHNFVLCTRQPRPHPLDPQEQWWEYLVWMRSVLVGHVSMCGMNNIRLAKALMRLQHVVGNGTDVVSVLREGLKEPGDHWERSPDKVVSIKAMLDELTDVGGN